MRLIRISTAVCFIILLALGLWLASTRCLWNDEYFSLISSTLENSYQSILLGNIMEGGNSPLFYILQKTLCDLFSYHPPQEWFHGHWQGVHVFDQVFLRIQSVLWVSAAVSVLFYYFARNYSLLAAVYALAVTLTSSLFWFHWTEARPYAGWFALTIFQLLLLLDICKDPVDRNAKNLGRLGVVHLALVLMTTLSAVQIIAAVVMLWIFKRPRWYWYVLLLLIPLGICSFYYTRSQHFYFFFVDGPVALISACLPKDRLFLIFASAIYLIFGKYRRDWKGPIEIKYLVFLLLVLAGDGLLLLKLRYTPSDLHGFQISSRYFLPLVPVGIIGTAIFSIAVVRAMPVKIWRTMVMIVLALFLIYRTHRTIQFFPHDYHFGASKEA